MKKFFNKILNICHSELVSEFQTNLVKNKMLNIVDLVKSLLVKCFSMTKSSEMSLVSRESITSKQSKETGHSTSHQRRMFTFNIKEILKQVQNDIMVLFTTHDSRLTKFAFTLAETLVVMGIIGVVAALTIPNLNQSTGDREKVAKVKKIYANLEDAYGRATAVYGPINEWCTNLPQDTTCNERVADRIKEFMKISKDCGTNTEGCFSKSPLLNVEGDTLFSNYYSSLSDSDIPMFMLADGTSVAVFVFNSANIEINSYIFVDIDGPTKGKNQEGVDKFDFLITKDGVFPNGFDNKDNDGAWNDSYSWFNSLWVIRNENLDYLKCPDELDWNTKTSCK